MWKLGTRTAANGLSVLSKIERGTMHSKQRVDTCQIQTVSGYGRCICRQGLRLMLSSLWLEGGCICCITDDFWAICEMLSVVV